MFAGVIRRACKKASKGQAQAYSARTRGLLVNLMATRVAEDLVSQPHRAAAEQALQGLDPTRFGLDLFAYCVRMRPRGVGALFSVYENTRISEVQLRHLLGSERP